MEYLLLIYDDEAQLASASDDDRQAMYGEYGAYTKAIRESGNMIGGNQLVPSSAGTTVRVRNGETLVTDGPYAETKEQLGGYYHVTAENIDEALELASRIPSARGGVIEVRPIVDVTAHVPEHAH